MLKNYVGFVFGGESAESDVSVVTALGLEKQTRGFCEFEPMFLYVSSDLEFYAVPRDLMKVETFKNPKVQLKKHQVFFEKGGIVRKKNSLTKTKLFVLDAVVNCTHGGYGESGELSGFMKMLDIPFSTFSPLAMALSMNKNLFKTIMRASGILVPNWVYFSKSDWLKNRDELCSKIESMRFPVVVKPNSSGSSLGVVVASSMNELYDGIDVAFKFDSHVIVEKCIQNKVEFNCAVLGDTSSAVVSDIDQIETGGKFFSFNDKYIGNAGSCSETSKNSITEQKKNSKGMEFAPRLLPAPISDSLTQKIQHISADVFKVLGLSGISRVDFLYDKKKKKLYVGEINAVPGSMALYFFRRTKLGVHGVLSKLVKIAKAEHGRKLVLDQKFIPEIF